MSVLRMTVLVIKTLTVPIQMVLTPVLVNRDSLEMGQRAKVRGDIVNSHATTADYAMSLKLHN